MTDEEIVKEARENIREVSIHFARGLAKPVTLADGREMMRVSIPNIDSGDKSPWAYFLLPANIVHENQYGKGLWAKIRADGSTLVSKPIPERREGDRTIWGRDQVRISNEELKAVVESYKTKERPSVLDQLGKAKEEGRKPAQRPPGRKQPAKAEPAL